MTFARGLLSISVVITTLGVADSRRRLQKETQEAASLSAEYLVVVLPAPAQLTDTLGQGVRARQSVGAGRIADAPYPEQSHAVLWQQAGGVAVDLNPPDFRYSAALETDGQRQVGHGNGLPTEYARHALLWGGSAASFVDLYPPDFLD
jgi:hypothetical protein